MTVPEFPTGDLLTAIDNDQVLIKKWTVRKDNRAQISVLTSVCVAQISPYGTLQLQPSLAPRNWSKRIKVAKENPEERTKVIEACSPSETDKNVIRHEDCKWRASFVYKSFVHPEILKEQAGRWRGIYPCHA
ncbi:PREDICTED: uncharacterized protein LOC107340345 isoform X2 [Acropora digitifera]|uniref:uncharacterized protein LOC107340345 isoform X2 n=1 Tax=Acropora digitifera TaxID=70779 RepID=UPI00077ACB4E|nr:PREDICTED: uncharacterized protein LOC107340345 isoform X2 [Acropora digitifera]